jgi:hypothetical protein
MTRLSFGDSAILIGRRPKKLTFNGLETFLRDATRGFRRLLPSRFARQEQNFQLEARVRPVGPGLWVPFASLAAARAAHEPDARFGFAVD